MKEKPLHEQGCLYWVDDEELERKVVCRKVGCRFISLVDGKVLYRGKKDDRY